MQVIAEQEQARPGDSAPLGGIEATTVVAAALGLAVFGWHAWLTLRGYFWQDDFRYLTLAATKPLGSLLVTGYSGHLMPGQFLLVWLLTAVAPMKYTVAVLPVLALQAVAYVLTWKVLVRLFGHRWAILVPYAVVVCSPLVLAATLWWAYALQVLPLEVSLLAALYAHVGYLRTGRRRDAVLGLVWTAVGLACWEKALLIAPVLFGVTVALNPHGGLLSRLVVTLRRYRRLWTGYAVLELGYLVLFLVAVPDTKQSPLTAADLGRLAQRMIADTFLPGVLGGPWRVRLEGPLILAVPPVWVLAVAWAVAAVVLLAGLRAGGRRAVLGWLLLVGYLASSVIMIAVARLSLFGTAAGGDPRYIADAVLVAALCGALAFLRPKVVSGSAAPAAPVTARGAATAPTAVGLAWAAPAEGTPAPEAALTPDGGPAPDVVPTNGAGTAAPTGRRRALAVLATVLAVAFVAGAAVSADRMSAPARHSGARQYVEQARSAFDYDPTFALVDSDVPDDVMFWLYGPDRRASQIFAPLPHRPRFDQPTEDLRILDPFGVPRPVTLVNTVAAPPGPVNLCGYAVGDKPVKASLPPPALPGRLVVRLRYFTGTSTAGTLQVGDTRLPVRFGKGARFLYAVVDGPVYDVELTGGRGSTVCVNEVLVGTPVPNSS
jgi:hypothetical protein